ncbi:MAG: pantetheine-phosphate adenylyltransferase [Thermoplasmata archaeon]|nr:pantetheine-phosphate adenylyltransferase [Thermoplasmata archaeon]
MGGTFDRIHRGHIALFDAVFRISRTVGIGLTTHAFLARHPKPFGRKIRPFGIRRRALVQFLHTRYPGRSWEILPLESAMGGAVEPEVDAIVVSEETARVVPAINRERRRRGVPPLRAVVVSLVHGQDLQPISGRRIRAGLVDKNGRRRRPVVIRISANVPGSLSDLEKIVSRDLKGLPHQFRARPWPTDQRKPSSDARSAAYRIRGSAEYAIALYADRRGALRLADAAADDRTNEVRGQGPSLARLVRSLVKARRRFTPVLASERDGSRRRPAAGRSRYVSRGR